MQITITLEADHHSQTTTRLAHGETTHITNRPSAPASVPVPELRAVVDRLEQLLLDEVADPGAASAAEVELIELWRELVLAVERAESAAAPSP